MVKVHDKEKIVSYPNADVVDDDDFVPATKRKKGSVTGTTQKRKDSLPKRKTRQNPPNVDTGDLS